MPALQEPPRVVVIGSGIGGSASSLLLSHVGLPVTLLEKNVHLGGTCAGYEKQGFHIDFSTHVFSRGSKGPFGAVLRRTGHDGALEFLQNKNIAEFRYPARDGSGGIERIPFPSQVYRWPMMGTAMARAMNLGPRDMLAGVRMMTDLMTMSDAKMATWLDRSVTDYTAQFSGNPRLVGVLNYLLTLFFVIPTAETSAGEAIYCFQRMMRDNSLGYPRGGSKTIPTTYARLAEANGAKVHTRAGVEKILVDDGAVRGVKLADDPSKWEDVALDTARSVLPRLDKHTVFIDRTSKHWMEHWLGKEYGPVISAAQTPDQVGKNRPSVATPVRGLYLTGDSAGGRGIGTELAADSTMECAERILADIGRTNPDARRTDRYKRPPLAGLAANSLGLAR
ncbi:MAG: NAD(P)-binding protein [Mycobacterium sp.]|nr:NAD(P)-binding protein [Mycobacterium sp.]